MKKSLLAIALLSSLSTVALANQAGDILVRGGATMVSPDSSKTAVFLDGADSGLQVSVDDNTQLGLNFVYFFDNNWAIELLAATPFDHDIKLHNGDTTTLLADTKQLPPTLSALYYFDTGSAFKPYVGLGINYTIFFDNSFTKTYSDAGFSDLDLDNSFGFSAQLGADYDLGDNWSVNVSARYIDISTDASFKVSGTTNGLAAVDVNPMVYSVMLGYTF
ncbi:OmpW/AlkL family protein [Candidatus Colwellia aromaticivorans]|uniref:OmpW/AlkL family protein n=1 Tax=Candidatus Colwellia aromaticivorans TaxID=2267621 RepID=UPI000DF404F8|nr:OmpW family outer membrane protein [Candidatus Colwellia aromaticivorans]